MYIFFKKHIPVLILSFLIVILAVLASDTAYLTIELTGLERNQLQVFWSTKTDNYSESRSFKLTTTKGRNLYTVALENALFIERVRVDLQQGQGENVPKPILLHLISYNFNNFFKNSDFGSDLKGINLIQGIDKVKNSKELDTIIFSHVDPILDFEMKMRPIYPQMILPVLFLLLLHAVVISPVLQGKKNLYRMELVVPADRGNAIAMLNSVLQKKGIQHKILRSTISTEGLKLQMEIELISIATIYAILSQLQSEERITTFNIVANRSGEIG